jgi:hypothetical protein|tara:strand:- start:152 stop:445 length:294 start_codon:yes stop_codon:yes gene_type:complete
MNTNIIKIEKNIPIPKIRWGSGKVSRLNFVKDLDVGDSFVINGNTPDITPLSALNAAYSLAYKLRKKGGKTADFKVTCRVIDGNYNKPKAVRIWRAQ